MLAELFQPMHMLTIVAILVLFFEGRWFAMLGSSLRDAIRNFGSY